MSTKHWNSSSFHSHLKDGEGTVFTDVFVHREGEGTASLGKDLGPETNEPGYPAPLVFGSRSSREEGVVPQSGLGTAPGPGQGYPFPQPGPGQGYTLPQEAPGYGYSLPLARTRTGVAPLPGQDQDKGTPPSPLAAHAVDTTYNSGGIPLAFSRRRTFLFEKIFTM